MSDPAGLIREAREEVDRSSYNKGFEGRVDRLIRELADALETEMKENDKLHAKLRRAYEANRSSFDARHQ